MSKSKLTLIIDGNWLLMSRMSVIYNRYMNGDAFSNELKLLMTKSIAIVLKTFPSIDNIIFVTDGGSWRNDVPVPKFLAEAGIDYKGNREKSTEIDWDLVFNTYEEYYLDLHEAGITVCHAPHVEGDDWCWYLSTTLNSEDTNCIIWSKDKDLTQLVHTNDDGCFTVCWSADGGFVTDNVEEEELDFFFNMNYNENSGIYRKITATQDVKKINPKAVVIDKILRGDAGDNIQPIILRESKSGSDKKFRINTKDIDNTLDIDDHQKVQEYLTNLLEQKAYKDRVTRTPEQILEHFYYNKNLVYLNRDSFPDDIIESMQFTPRGGCVNTVKPILEKLSAHQAGITNILETI